MQQGVAMSEIDKLVSSLGLAIEQTRRATQ